MTSEKQQASISSLPQGSQLAWSLCDWIDHVSSNPNPPSPWTVVWQPSSIGEDYSAVIQNTTTNQYALVIQGTHGAPDELEDFCCEFWAGFEPVSGAKVAIGAQAALFGALMQMNAKLTQGGTDLASYLQSISGSFNATTPLLITGHSLGGTVAYLAACWIAFQFLNNQQPITTLPSSIQSFTFAPFAAGNQALADVLNASSNYVPCFNLNDAIPHVWATDTNVNPTLNMTNFFLLFPSPGPNPMPNNSLQAALQNKVTLMQNNQVSYVQTTGLYSYVFTYPTDWNTWDGELIRQHNYAYSETFASTGNAETAPTGAREVAA
ncbi:hypothetical protein AB4Y89_18435 [Terriglobus sp. 2YAB30_2]|uniref:lipase family protein n=1 Tax=unclassified Terriglobus TaxID=2628988 RepID=UPI003F957FF1